jgi:cold shock protein
MMGKTRGKVQWFSPEKGFGFIVCRDTPSGEAEVFVNHSCIQSRGFRRLEKGQEVEFELAVDERGYFAKNVKVL